MPTRCQRDQTTTKERRRKQKHQAHEMATSVARDTRSHQPAIGTRLSTEDHDDEVGGRRDDGCQELRLVSLRQNEPSGKLGFSLRGGKEATGCSVGVFVSHVELAGQASKNGLRVGDQLIQVNGLQVSRSTYDEVIELIRRTPKRDEIRLLVSYAGRIPFQERSGQPIGWLQLSHMMTGAHDAARFNPSVSPLESSRKQSETISHKQADAYAMGSGASKSKAARAPNYQDDSAASSQSLTFTSSSSCSLGSAHSASSSDEDDERHISAVVSSSASSSSSGCSISMSSLQSGAAEELGAEIRVPGGRRTSEPFGCGVVKGPDEWPGIFVQHVKEASLAERVGLEPGDQLIQAEQFALNELPFEAAIKLIKQIQAQQDELVLIVRKGAALKHLAKGRCKQRQLAPALSEAGGRSTTTTTTSSEQTSAIGTDDSSNESSSGLRIPVEPDANTRRPLPRPPAQAPPAPPRAQRVADRRAVAQLENSISRASEFSAEQTSRQTRDLEQDDCSSAALRQEQHLAPRCVSETQRRPASNPKPSARLTDPIERCDSANGHQSLDGEHDKRALPLAPPTQARRATGASTTTFAASRASSPKELESIRAQARCVAQTVAAKSLRDAAKLAPDADRGGLCNAQYAKHPAGTTKRQDPDRQHDGEQIKIVRQNCKLHQHGASVQNLVKMSPFAKEVVGWQQKLARNQQAHSVHQPSIRQAQDLKRQAPLPSGQRFAPALQRYVSVDNLASASMPQRCTSSMHLDRLQAPAAPVNLQQRLRPPGQKLVTCPQPQRIYRRSNSVLGQTAAVGVASGDCCQQMSQFHAPDRDDLKLRLRASQCEFVQRAAVNCRPYPIGPTCNCSPMGDSSRQLASTATMRHMQMSQRILSNGRYKRQNNTLAMSKFKARSEDKLNLMNVNLSYVQIGTLNQCPTLSGRMLRAKQLQQQQPQVLCSPCCPSAAASSRTCRKMTCSQQVSGARTLCSTRDVRPSYAICPDQGRQQQPIYQYATAMGIIANTPVSYQGPVDKAAGCTMRSLGSAKSCCAIDRIGCPERLVALPSFSLNVGCSDTDEVQTSCPCDTLSCSSSFYCPSEKQLLLMRRGSESASVHPLPPGTVKKRAQQNGASTDSSGYQSACNLAAETRACPLLGQPALRQRDTSQNLSTFNPVRPASRASGAQNSSSKFKSAANNQLGALSTLTNAGQCNNACSPTSLSPSCSPTSSPASVVILTGNSHRHQAQLQQQYLRHQRHHDSSLSPLSSMSPSSHSPASSRSSSPQQANQFASKQMSKSTGPTSKLLARKQSRQSKSEGGKGAKLVPCPPPMPVVGPDGRTLTRPTGDERRKPTICNDLHPKSRSHEPSPSVAPPTTKQKLQQQRASGEHAIERPQLQQQQIGKLNRLCFVDELKMLASAGQPDAAAPADSSQAKSSSSAGETTKHVDSSTLIKMINANNRAASQQRKQQQVNCSTCCQLVKSGANKMPAGACCFAAGGGIKSKLGAVGQLESKSVKLRDEEDNKRRQHELLMEEFKTAHSKMFNKLRQTNVDKEQLDGDRAESCGNHPVASADSNNNQELKSSARS